MTQADSLSLSVRDVRDQVTRVKATLEAMATVDGDLFERVQGVGLLS